MTGHPDPGPRVVTLGCRLNALESEVIRREAVAAGAGDAIVVNTCAVTGEAVRQARQAIRRLRRERPDARIIVTGCAAQLDPRAFAAMPEVDQVLGNREKLDRRHLTPAAADAERLVVSDIMAAGVPAGPLIDGFAGRTRAFVQVQQGCDHRCTFCIIPFARGPNRSLEADRIVAQVRRLAAGGYAEVVLTGVDICSWRGGDGAGAPGLGHLVRRILAGVSDLARLRLSTVDPAAIDDELLAALAEEPRLMPHLHLSLQAADDLVLKRMKRRHDRALAAAVVDRVRRARPDIVLGADLIAGFPTETEAMFANTLAAVDELGLTFLHVFPFSPRTGTPAARMPQVPAAERRARAERLRTAGAGAVARHYAAQVGRTVDALIEAPGRGRGPDYAPLRLDGGGGPAGTPGAIVPVRVTGYDDQELVAELTP